MAAIVGAVVFSIIPCLLMVSEMCKGSKLGVCFFFGGMVIGAITGAELFAGYGILLVLEILVLIYCVKFSSANAPEEPHS